MKTETISEQKISLENLWSKVMVENGIIAVWRCPREKTVHFLGDFSETPAKGRIDLQKTDMGFVVSPFMNPEGNETLFLKADIYAWVMEDNSWKIVHGKRKMENGSLTSSLTNSYHLNHRPDTEISGEKNHFIDMVENGIKAIEDGEFDKVVSARTYDEPLAENFNVIEQFNRLEQAYPDAFVSLVSIPGRGTWMGATPELLIETSSEHFRTVSVAGTQPFPVDKDLSKAAWNQKEIEEQAMVSRYIIEQFKTIRLREFVETGPRSVRAGNMIHLKTEYMVDLNEVHFPELGTVMLHLLHPTSAVCGMPKYSALRFIAANEHLNREFYSGFLGPVNMDGVSRLYVNLRCMQILRTRAVLYAGAGITHDSIPEKEWEETALKCQTLLDVMNGHGATKTKE
ncbi:MAG: chorismate-binding protein [Candidatus Marinimicrobia bacterium]|jgi:isochorismate synthase|nr:chorismate-binding protein [Candidatus Neomarinimicrobiota bacterium]MDP6611178.1 chorismate-binding protein [Candidatus Neomarinimicrobiota bacterium]|tara:strand:- start:9026 stop:10222 length:1197 start_codon:yes stop_codon:yes gene_type:complete